MQNWELGVSPAAQSLQPPSHSLSLNQSLTEVLKFTSPRDLLRYTSLVSSKWLHHSNSDEVWTELLHFSGFSLFSLHFPSKWQFRRCARQTLKLVILRYNNFCVFDCRTEKWREYPKTGDLKEIVDSVGNFAPDGRIVWTGGRTLQGLWGISSVYQVGNDSEVESLEDMRYPRTKHAAVVVASTLYVFGGQHKELFPKAYSGADSVRCSSRVVWKTCESLDLQGKSGRKWSVLPNLQCAKSALSACSHGTAIYLCASIFSPQIDVFDTLQGRFRLVPVVFPCNPVLIGSMLVSSQGLILCMGERNGREVVAVDAGFVLGGAREGVMGLSAGTAYKDRVYVKYFGGAVGKFTLYTDEFELLTGEK